MHHVNAQETDRCHTTSSNTKHVQPVDSITVSVDVSELGIRRSCFSLIQTRIKRCILAICFSSTETAASDSTCSRKQVYHPCSRTVHLQIALMKLWSFCAEKHRTSFLQTFGPQTIQISIQLTKGDLGCHVAL